MMVELLENTDAVRKEIQMGYEIKIRKSTRPVEMIVKYA